MRRWIHLPQGTQIRSSGTVAITAVVTTTLSMDRWQFPQGTRFIQELSHPSGPLVETRLLERLPDVAGYPVYRMGSFRWSDNGDSGTQTARYTETGSTGSPSGPDPIQLTVSGETFVHRIPTSNECRRCHHGEPGRALGFSAFQLAKDAPDDISLASLVASGKLTSTTGYSAAWRFPIDNVTYDPVAPAPPTLATFGALHAECGHCHNAFQEAEASYIDTTGLSAPSIFELRMPYGQGYLQSAQAYRSSVDRPAVFAQLGHTLRVESGLPDNSIVWLRSGLRAGMTNGGYAMPPLGTAVVNTLLQSNLAAWIEALP